jgi:hypothetical protein
MTERERFGFRLALALGYPHPDVLLDQITERQFQAWIGYYNTEPFGQERQDVGHAIVSATLASAMTGKRHKPAAFMPRFGEDAPKPHVTEEHAGVFRAIAKRWNNKNG